MHRIPCTNGGCLRKTTHHEMLFRCYLSTGQGRQQQEKCAKRCGKCDYRIRLSSTSMCTSTSDVRALRVGMFIAVFSGRSRTLSSLVSRWSWRKVYSSLQQTKKNQNITNRPVQPARIRVLLSRIRAGMFKSSGRRRDGLRIHFISAVVLVQSELMLTIRDKQ